MIRPFPELDRPRFAGLNEVFSPLGSRYPKQGPEWAGPSIYEPLSLNARAASRLGGNPDIATTCRLR